MKVLILFNTATIMPNLLQFLHDQTIWFSNTKPKCLIRRILYVILSAALCAYNIVMFQEMTFFNVLSRSNIK